MSSPGEEMILLDEFLDQMSAKGYSPGTISYTRLYLQRFLDYLKMTGINNMQVVIPETPLSLHLPAPHYSKELFFFPLKKRSYLLRSHQKPCPSPAPKSYTKKHSYRI